jgi:cardiolipin synthase
VSRARPASSAPPVTGRELVVAPARLRPGHALEILVDGAEAYPAMLAAIRAARREIHLEVYIFETDEVGREFLGALMERAHAGVEVRLLVDGVGSYGLEDAVGAELAAAGVQLAVFGRLGKRWSLRRWLRRDHRKLLLVDGARGFVGGLNVGLEYAPRERGGAGWRDTHVELRGPALADLEAMFRVSWRRAGGAPYAPRPVDDREVPGGEWALALGRDHRGRRNEIRRHLLHAMRKASSRIWVASAYFVPEPAIRRALRGAARRGVDVRVIVPAESDLRAVQWGGEYSYAGLLRAGVRIFQWCASHMHAKTTVIDDAWSMVGSYNLDYVSLFYNQEVVVVVLGGHTAGRLIEVFQADLGPCREVELAAWVRRPWWRRGLAWLFYRFRRFL